jgi:hypothetical protein
MKYLGTKFDQFQDFNSSKSFKKQLKKGKNAAKKANM